MRLRSAASASAVILLIALAAGNAAAAFKPAGEQRAFKNAPGVYEWRYEETRGRSPFDRIALHRLSYGPTPPQHPEAVMLYLPGTNLNGEVPLDDPRHVLPLYLAAHGIDTWALDYRTHFIPPRTPAAQLGELREWTNELFESDIEAAAKFILAQTHQKKLFIAGFSRGATFAYLYAAAHPKQVAGLVILDGFLLDPKAAAVIALATRSAPGDRYADDLGGQHLTFDKRKALLELVIGNPDGPAPIPKYKTARENLEHVVYDAAGFGAKGGLANPQGGFSDPVILAHVMVQYDRYWPTVQDRRSALTADVKASLAHSAIPVIAFSSTNISPGWPELVTQSAHLTGASEVSVSKLDGWGHLDVICGEKAEAQVYRPLLDWLRQRAK